MQACSLGSTRSEIMRRNVGRKLLTSANPAAFLHIIDTSRLVKVLKDDKREIFRAAADANRIAEWILSHHPAHGLAADDPDAADDEQPSQAPTEALAA